MILFTWKRRTAAISKKEAHEFFDARLLQTHAFLFETHRMRVPWHDGAFSLKLVLGGEEHYRIGKRRVRLRPGDVLLVNAGERYRSWIDTRTVAFSVFFSDDELAAATTALSATAGRLLALPGGRDSVPEVPQVPLRLTRRALRITNASIRSLHCGTPGSRDEATATLLSTALREVLGAVPDTALPHVKKRATRDELISRVFTARDYIEDRHGEDCALHTLAEVACLSKYHFLRTFTELTGMTPAGYARRLRLRRARDAIVSGQSPDVAARQAGYSSRHALARALRTRKEWSGSN